MILGAEQGNGRAGFGQPIGVHKRDMGQHRQRSRYHRFGHLSATVGQCFEGRQCLPRFFHDVENAVEHGRHHHCMGDSFGCGLGDPLLGRESRQINDPAAAIGSGQHRRYASDVVGRNADQRRLPFIGSKELDCRHDIRGKVGMPQNRCLGLSGRAAGKKQYGDIAFAFLQLDSVRRGSGHECGFKFAPQNQFDAFGRDYPMNHLVIDHQHRGSGPFHQPAQIFIGEAVIERDKGGSRDATCKQKYRQGITIHSKKGRISLSPFLQPRGNLSRARAIGFKINSVVLAS